MSACQVDCCDRPHCDHQFSQGDPCWKPAIYKVTNQYGEVSYNCNQCGEELIQLLDNIKDLPMGISVDSQGREHFRPSKWKPPVVEKLAY